MSDFTIPTPEQAQWFMNRIEQFSSNRIEEVFINETDEMVHLTTSYEDYCMGCHMGTERESFGIPFGIFFSHINPKQWLDERKARLDAEKKAKEEQSRLEQQRIIERSEREELARLSRKYNEA